MRRHLSVHFELNGSKYWEITRGSELPKSENICSCDIGFFATLNMKHLFTTLSNAGTTVITSLFLSSPSTTSLLFSSHIQRVNCSPHDCRSAYVSALSTPNGPQSWKRRQQKRSSLAWPMARHFSLPFMVGEMMTPHPSILGLGSYEPCYCSCCCEGGRYHWRRAKAVLAGQAVGGVVSNKLLLLPWPHLTGTLSLPLGIHLLTLF